MRVKNLAGASDIYTSNVYLVQGTWDSPENVNTLIDVGRDVRLLEWLRVAASGTGKPPVEQVLITHSHYDHCEMLPVVCEEYSPRVLAASGFGPHVDRILEGGESVRAGDMLFEVIRCPLHTADSVCFLCSEAGILFSGDTPLVLRNSGVDYGEEYRELLLRLARYPLNTIYPGHGDPIVGNCRDYILKSLESMKTRGVS